MIFWKGLGILALVIAVLVGALFSLLFDKIGWSEDLGAAVGALVSATIIWFTGTRLNSPAKARVLIDKQTGREITVKPNHSLFFIKLQYWAFIIGGIGLFMIGDILIHGRLTV
ncbi:hypothetical protein [Puia sp.]|jgi:uncharacterized membrane protein YraQ (UPF0718 family)|uniref:hypothetical protein n=1 Tax=Puia sp. TaxID=2045100 RepID=UPI002F3E39DE